MKESFFVPQSYGYGKSEIYIIAKTGDTIIFIEVKARNGKDQDPLEAVTRDKMKRMMRTSDAYIGALTGDFNYRFDIVAFTGGKEDYKLEVYENAFYSPDLY